MKTMTCAIMGGPCDKEITGETPDEIIGNGMLHIEAAHPDMAADIKAMAKDDPVMVDWSKKFMENWEKTPQDE